jgi:cytoskeletal protein CcmA (bactofilin family)
MSRFFGGNSKPGAKEGTNDKPEPVPSSQREERSASGAFPGSTASPPSKRVEQAYEVHSPKGSTHMANIGKSITIQGDLNGNEDLTIEGKVRGKVDLPNNQLTIGQGGEVQAEVRAKAVVIHGTVSGNISASERVDIQGTGIVNGDIQSPKLSVAEGAIINGAVEMSAAKKSQAASVPSGIPPKSEPIQKAVG